jgi:hypothetical protein
MNCSRLGKWLPLYAGADLSARRSRRLEKHLETCADCRLALDELRAALAGVRDVAGREALDWPEADWKRVLARVLSAKPEPRRAVRAATFPRKAWAYGLAVILVLGAAVLVMKIALSPPAAPLLTEVLMPTPARPSRALMTYETPSPRQLQDVPYGVQPERMTLDRTLLAAGTTPEKTTQNMMSMTLVSQETGLQVHWTFNRNFEWEEKKE